MKANANANPGFARQLMKRLHRQWPDAGCELKHSNPLELLVAVILSAQCTDKRVNLVTPALFRTYRSAKDYAAASPLAFEKAIHSTGFFRSKSKSIREACRMLVEKFGGQVPRTMDELVQLPGVGRKTANVILGTAYGLTSGIVVDTHMIRLTGRLRLSAEKDPVKIEQDLIAILPRAEWIYFSYAMVLHGRYICVARSPQCFKCQLEPICPFPDKCLRAPEQ